MKKLRNIFIILALLLLFSECKEQKQYFERKIVLIIEPTEPAHVDLKRWY